MTIKYVGVAIPAEECPICKTWMLDIEKWAPEELIINGGIYDSLYCPNWQSHAEESYDSY